MPPEYPDLTPGKALIFRITHRDNTPWILDHGLHCQSSATKDPNFIAIGNQGLIEARGSRRVPVPPGGTLADFVPFYFAPRTPMLHNIQTGQGVQKRKKSEIVFIVTSLPELAKHGVRYVFTDRHAFLHLANFSSSVEDLHRLPWDRLKAKRYANDPEAPDGPERYQAEALAHRYVPVAAFLAITCYGTSTKLLLDEWVEQRKLNLEAMMRPGWYIP